MFFATTPIGLSLGLGVGVGRDTIRSADRCDLPPSPVGLSLGNGLGLGLGLVGVGLDTIRSADRCALPPPPLVGTKQPVAGRKAGRLHTPSSEPPRDKKSARRRFLGDDAVMSRRASVFARQNPGKRRVRFPDEVWSRFCSIEKEFCQK